jgi:hypothetical protein
MRNIYMYTCHTQARVRKTKSEEQRSAKTVREDSAPQVQSETSRRRPSVLKEAPLQVRQPFLMSAYERHKMVRSKRRVVHLKRCSVLESTLHSGQCQKNLDLAGGTQQLPPVGRGRKLAVQLIYLIAFRTEHQFR